MGQVIKYNRRTFIGGQLAVASLAFTGSSMALTPFSDSMNENVWLNSNWEIATEREFSTLIHQTFSAYSKDGHVYNLKLIEVEALNSGFERPASLARSEGVSLNFKADFPEDFADDNHHFVTMRHPLIGDFDVMLTTHPRRSGNLEIQLILN